MFQTTAIDSFNTETMGFNRELVYQTTTIERAAMRWKHCMANVSEQPRSKTNANLNTLWASETTSSTWDTWELKRLSSNVWRRKIGIGACVSQHSYRKLFQNWAIVWKTQENFAEGKKLLFPLLSKVLWRNNWKWGLSLQGLEIPEVLGKQMGKLPLWQ